MGNRLRDDVAAYSRMLPDVAAVLDGTARVERATRAGAALNLSLGFSTLHYAAKADCRKVVELKEQRALDRVLDALVAAHVLLTDGDAGEQEANATLLRVDTALRAAGVLLPVQP